MSANPSLEVRDHFIAYFDVLGYQQIINKYNTEHGECGENIFLGIINKVMNDAFASLAQHNAIYTLASLEPPHLSIDAFSDNMIVSIPVEQVIEANIVNSVALISYISDLQTRLACEYGIFIRGSITKGKFYRNERFVFGSGIIDAYKAENELAIYPRIIIKQELLNVLKPSEKDLVILKFVAINNELLHLIEGTKSEQSMQSLLQSILSICETVITEINMQQQIIFSKIDPKPVLLAILDLCKQLSVENTSTQISILIDQIRSSLYSLQEIIIALELNRKEIISILLSSFIKSYYYLAEDGILSVHHLGNHSIEVIISMLKILAPDLPSEINAIADSLAINTDISVRYANDLLSYKKEVEKNLKITTHEKVASKYLWAANYYNAICFINQQFDNQIKDERVRYYHMPNLKS